MQLTNHLTVPALASRTDHPGTEGKPPPTSLTAQMEENLQSAAPLTTPQPLSENSDQDNQYMRPPPPQSIPQENAQSAKAPTTPKLCLSPTPPTAQKENIQSAATPTPPQLVNRPNAQSSTPPSPHAEIGDRVSANTKDIQSTIPPPPRRLPHEENVQCTTPTWPQEENSDNIHSTIPPPARRILLEEIVQSTEPNTPTPPQKKISLKVKKCQKTSVQDCPHNKENITSGKRDKMTSSTKNTTPIVRKKKNEIMKNSKAKLWEEKIQKKETILKGGTPQKLTQRKLKFLNGGTSGIENFSQKENKR